MARTLSHQWLMSVPAQSFGRINRDADSPQLTGRLILGIGKRVPGYCE